MAEKIADRIPKVGDTVEYVLTAGAAVGARRKATIVTIWDAGIAAPYVDLEVKTAAEDLLPNPLEVAWAPYDPNKNPTLGSWHWPE